jgi:hypothetical protein
MKVQCIRLDPDGVDVLDALETIDISRSGVGAMSERSFYPGQRILLCMPLTSLNGQRNIYAKVVRCRQEEQGYNIGLEFDAESLGVWNESIPATIAA